MVKIEITVVDSKNNGECTVNIGKTKHLKSSTDNEKMVANSVHNALKDALKTLSK